MVIRNYKQLFFRFTKIVLLTLIFFSGQHSRAQDSTAIIDYSNNFIVRLYTITKFNSLIIGQSSSEKDLVLEPNGVTNLGIGINYKRVGIGLTYGLPSSPERERIYGKTTRFDLQGSIYGTKIGGDGFAQYYKGYFNSNPNDYIDWPSEEFPQLSSMQVLSLGLSAFYIFNSSNYSYRAAFVRDQMQHHSSGSFLLGPFAYYDDARTDAGFIPIELADSIPQEIDLKEFNNLSIGVSAGYAYNLILWHNFILGGAVLPGFGYQRVHITKLNGVEGVENQPAAQLLIKAALGYDKKAFYVAATGSVNFRNISYNSFDFGLSTEQFRVIAGYRFGVD